VGDADEISGNAFVVLKLLGPDKHTKGPGAARGGLSAVWASQDAGTSRTMPPPTGTIGAGDGAANMAFRRRASATSNCGADQARAALVKAFTEADLDHSGMVNKEELAVVIRDQLHIQLQDPVNDLDIIFGSPNKRTHTRSLLPTQCKHRRTVQECARDRICRQAGRHVLDFAWRDHAMGSVL
jgi:hypothetical protein